MSTDDELNLDQYRQWIQLGRVDEVLSALEKLSLKKAVSTKSLLIELIPVLRRAGAYEEALKLLTHFDDRSPERDLEEALLLGELGATASALNKIRSISPSQIATSLHFDLAFHRGNFESVARDFEASAETFRKLSESPQLTELQVGIAKLNFLGARV
ncbi:MAG: hypothetical protein EOP05_10550 [Proteobacteria bacterium]|nr:MAG: hypothetical protein EOP05_10550 [Pseudomonadota bacterium]